ncbi:MAG: deoxyguanosinetriphosphate triphosphohydrolase [Nitrospirota bacterium]|nr:deoxyguanosinetriphosphate triphosphohydrolase [Nitrospirota bacterium]
MHAGNPLGPFASPDDLSRGRVYPEEEHPYRTKYQRDRDRIIHSKAFRRLEYKTQVFVNHEDGNYRTRLTHTLEVMQIARTISRALGLNEDLTEAIALGHDIGHPPFGHTGEATMNRLTQDCGGFEHNLQGLRIVDELEELYGKFPGLNLTYEVREGILKYKPNRNVEIPEMFRGNAAPTLEAQVVDMADEIAYSSHDIDDGLASGLISLQGLVEVPLARDCVGEIEKETGSDVALPILIKAFVRKLINNLVSDVIVHTAERLNTEHIENPEAARSKTFYLVGLSVEMAPKNNALNAFLMNNLYRHPKVLRMGKKASRVLESLFSAYQESPQLLPVEVQQKMKSQRDTRKIADYIASMTDRFVLEEYAKLFDPFEKF